MTPDMGRLGEKSSPLPHAAGAHRPSADAATPDFNLLARFIRETKVYVKIVGRKWTITSGFLTKHWRGCNPAADWEAVKATLDKLADARNFARYLGRDFEPDENGPLMRKRRGEWQAFRPRPQPSA